jgi:hypothetical protein
MNWSIVLCIRLDAGKIDIDELVAIPPALLVPKAHGMPDLMNAIAGAAGSAENDVLTSATPADRRGASIAGTEKDKIYVCGVVLVPCDEFDRRVVLPVLHRIGHALLVRQRGVDFKRQGVVFPAELRANNCSPEQLGAGLGCGRIMREELFDGLCLRYGAQDDAPFKHGETVDGRIGHLLPRLAKRLDKGRIRQAAGEKSFGTHGLLLAVMAHRAVKSKFCRSIGNHQACSD